MLMDVGAKMERAVSSYIPGLDGLRAISILMVMLGHVGYSFIPAGMGVAIFFAISGFLITGIILREQVTNGAVNWKTFYLKRALRLYPELIALCLLVWLYCLMTGKAYAPIQFVAALFYFTNYLQIFSIVSNDMSFVTRPLWSLAVEEHFYLLMPVCLLIVRRNTRALLLILAMVIILILCWRIFVESAGLFGKYRLDYLNFATETRMDGIAFGCLISALLASGYRDRFERFYQKNSTKILVVGLLILLASITIRDPFFRSVFKSSFQALGSFLLVSSVVVAGCHGWVIRILEWSPIRLIGKVSYGAYLYHLLIFEVVRGALPLTGHFENLFLLLVSLAFACLSYYLLERPLIPVRRRLGNRSVKRDMDEAASLAFQSPNV